MEKYPQELTAGPPDYQTTYQLVPDQVLIKVREDADEKAMADFLSAGFLEAADEPEHKQRARRTLEPAGLRWVTLPADDDKALESAMDSLEAHADVEEVRPIYFASGGGPETATTPVIETVMIQIEDDLTEAALEALDSLGLKHNESFSQALAPIHVFNFADESTITFEAALAVAEQAASVAGVEAVEFDWLKLETYQAAPNDTLFGNQWNMATIRAAGAWDIDDGNTNTWVAIIDSGFDLTHPDLTFTPNTAANPTHCNADAFIAGQPTPYNASSSGVFHGTACAGIAAATVNNNRGVAGVAGGCRIMPVRLGTVPTSARVAAGINWARQNGAVAGSLSLSTGVTTAAVTAVVNAWNAGMILCAATGNGGGNNPPSSVNFPANHANTIAVGASDQNDQRKRPASADNECWGSQFGPEIDVIAPGVQIWTTDEQGASGYNSNNGGATGGPCVNYASSGDASGDYVAVFNGTSAATPHVAGLAALLRSINPSQTNQQVRNLIESTCDKVSPALYAYAATAGKPNGTWHQEVGYGRINARVAVDRAIATVGRRVENHKWTEGWTTANFYTIGKQTYLFLLKEKGAGADGKNVHIHKIKSNGKVGSRVQSHKWTQGWSTANFYTIGSQTYLFLLKEKGAGADGKNVHIHKMKSDGKVGSRVQSHKWTEGWTTANFYTIGTQTYLFLLKEKGKGADGNNVHIHKIKSDGKVGGRVQSHKWTQGWTTANFYTVGRRTYLFLLKAKGAGADGKNVHIHRMRSDGKVGSRVQSRKWTQGWTTANFYTIRTMTYLFLLKEKGKGADGSNVHMHRMRSNGRVGGRFENHRWTEGWTTANFYTIGTRTYLFLLKKKGAGADGNNVHIHRVGV